jgi:hypothetical protein
MPAVKPETAQIHGDGLATLRRRPLRHLLATAPTEFWIGAARCSCPRALPSTNECAAAETTLLRKTLERQTALAPRAQDTARLMLGPQTRCAMRGGTIAQIRSVRQDRSPYGYVEPSSTRVSPLKNPRPLPDRWIARSADHRDGLQRSNQVPTRSEAGSAGRSEKRVVARA